MKLGGVHTLLELSIQCPLYPIKINSPKHVRENTSLTSSTLKDVKLSNGNTGFRELSKSSSFLCTMTVFSSLPDLKLEPNFPSEPRDCHKDKKSPSIIKKSTNARQPRELKQTHYVHDLFFQKEQTLNIPHWDHPYHLHLHHHDDHLRFNRNRTKLTKITQVIKAITSVVIAK